MHKAYIALGDNMLFDVIAGVILPLIGTSLGAACVLVLKKEIGSGFQRCLRGFAGGVMVAASVWSLIIPAIEYSAHYGKLAFLPASIGLWLGVAFLLALERFAPVIKKDNRSLIFAVTLHNLPEGMAVGAAFAGAISGEVALSAAMALSIGVAIQNVPEGAVVSMPLRSDGYSRSKSFFGGVASGLVEPIGAMLVLALTSWLMPVLPVLLAFAAGAMIYVVITELLYDADNSFGGIIAFFAGFSVMMILDVAL